MSNEELMKRRWEVIAAFPDNRNYEVGSILDRDWCRYINDDDESQGTISKISEFPHLFRELGWWEKRKIEDMPMYLKQTGMVDGADNPVPDWYLKVKKHFSAGNGEWRDDSINIFCTEKTETTIGVGGITYSSFEPATEDEYLSNIAKLKTVQK